MKKIILLHLICLFFLLSCSEKSEPEFYYIKNNSSFPIELSYNETLITVEPGSEEKIDTTSNISYSLNKNIVTFIDENSKRLSEEIELLTVDTYEGYYGGEFCTILKFQNNENYSRYSLNEEFAYEISNNTKESLFAVCKSFSERLVEIESSKSKTFSFLYKNPEIYFLTASEYSKYKDETDETSKQNILKNNQTKTIKPTPSIIHNSNDGTQSLLYKFVYTFN